MLDSRLASARDAGSGVHAKQMAAAHHFKPNNLSEGDTSLGLSSDDPMSKGDLIVHTASAPRPSKTEEAYCSGIDSQYFSSLPQNACTLRVPHFRVAKG